MGNRRKDMKAITCFTFTAVIWAMCVQDVTCGIQVVAPSVLRPYNSYQVALVSSGLRSASVLVSVDGRRSNGQPYSQSKEVHLMPASARLVELEIGDPGPGFYELTVKSTAGTQFSSAAPLTYQNRSFCIFVQTDKRVYQPKDSVSFRVIALNKYLLPLSGYVDVTIFDAGGSPVRQWIQAPLDRGILADEFVLADQPALGEWTIQVETKSQTYDTRILIADYVEPKFSITLDVPKTILFSEGKFTTVITAKYFNGLPVRGELTLAAFPIFFSDIIQPVVSSPTRKVVIIDGSVNVTFDMKKDLNLAEDAVRPLIIEALIEEENTGRRQNVSTRTLLMRTPYRIHLHSPGHFKPGLPFNIQLEAVNSEGKVYKNGSGTATVLRIWDDGSPPNETTIQVHSGIGLYSFVPDRAHNMSTLNFEVTYMDVKERINNIKSSFAIGGHFINSQLVDGKIMAGSDINLLVRVTEDIDMLNYVVLARGDILEAKTEEIAPPRNTLNVKIPSTNLMAPGAVVLLWYPRLTGEIISTALHVPIEGMLQNKVEVGIAPTQSRPAGSAEFSLITTADSHGGILGLDMETVTTKLTQPNGLGNGLSMDMIKRELESFGGISHQHKSEESALANEIGDINAADTFQKSGVIILTDGIVNDINPSVSATPPPMIETGTRPPLAGPYAFSRLPPPPAPRFYLASRVHPTWVFSNLTVGPDGKGLITRKVPTVLGDWLVGGFAVHPTLGLGLATPVTFTSTQTLSLSVDLPPSLQKGETIALVVSLTSTLTAEANVELTFHNSEQYFEFEPLSNDLSSPKKIELYRRQKVSIPATGTRTTAFLITTVRAGQAPVIIETSGNGLSASFYSMLTIEPIGEEEEMMSWEILDARRGIAKANLTLTPPLGARTGDISMLVAGDLMAPALNSLKKLPRLSGDADQAIHPVVVGCTLLNYLQATERDEAGIIATAQSLLEAGNQRVLAYRTPNGSFSIDAEDKVGDVWVTSLAARWLSQAARFVPISPVPAQDASKWLVQQQQPDGSWTVPSKNRVAPHMQGTVPLTALALIALLDGQGSSILYKNTINKALDYLVKQLPTEEDPFNLAILAKALSTARHPERLQPLQLLDLHAKTKDDQKWWGRKVPEQEKRSPWTMYNTIDIETTAYGLQALLDADLVDDALPVARWLLAAGSQDNSAKVEALASLALKIRTSNKLHLTASLIGTQETRQFNIEDNNSLIVQTQLVKNTRNISILTDGRGFAVAGLKAPVVTNVTGAWPRFTLDPRVDRTSTIYKLQLSICSGFVAVGNETQSGLTLMKVRLPSGFTADLDTLTALQSAYHVRSAELSRDGTEVYAWLSPMKTSEYCATLIAARTYPVARQKPGWVKLQDCYDSSHRARVFFNPIRGTLCDACREFDSCSNVCGNPSSQLGEAPEGDDSSSKKSSAEDLTIMSLCSVIMLSLVNFYLRN